MVEMERYESRNLIKHDFMLGPGGWIIEVTFGDIDGEIEVSFNRKVVDRVTNDPSAYRWTGYFSNHTEFTTPCTVSVCLIDDARVASIDVDVYKHVQFDHIHGKDNKTPGRMNL